MHSYIYSVFKWMRTVWNFIFGYTEDENFILYRLEINTLSDTIEKNRYIKNCRFSVLL